MSVAADQEKSAPQRCQRLFGEMKNLNIGMYRFIFFFSKKFMDRDMDMNKGDICRMPLQCSIQ